MHSRVLLIIFCLLSGWMRAGVIVYGEARGYEGRKVAVVALDDEFSAKRTVLAQCDVNDAGVFKLEFSVRSTQRVYLHIQRVEAPLYVQQASTYSVVFPSVSEKEYKRFDRTEVSLQFRDLPESDINFIIRKFNSDYALFIREHFYDFATDEYRGASEYLRHLGADQGSVDLFARRMNEDSIVSSTDKGFGRWVSNFADSVKRVIEPSSDAVFTELYKHYALGELFLLSGMNRKEFYEKYFMSITPDVHNPSFAGCFRLFISNVLTGRKAAIQSAIVKSINVERDLLRLAEALCPETELISERLKRMAAVIGLQEVYNNKSFDQSSIDILLKKVQTGDTLVDEMAAAALYQIKRCKTGWPIDDFKFTDENQERWALENADGLPVCMLFFASWSPSSLKEVFVLERWQEKFRGRMQFVAVCMDDDYRYYRKYLEDNLKLPLKLLYGNAEPMVHEKFNLKAIPHSVILDARGMVVADVCPLPSDPQIESFLSRVAAAAAPAKQGPKTWKDN